MEVVTSPTQLQPQPLILIHRIVVFDLDETLGYFKQLSVLVRYLLPTHVQFNHVPNESTMFEFNRLLDLFPEYVRPGMFDILQFIQTMKQSHQCSQVLIYTNNQSPPSWLTYLLHYFHTQCHARIFDKVVAAFEVNGQRVQWLRTSHAKTHSDLLQCIALPSCTQICYIDDTYHSGMQNEQIYYLQIQPYVHTLTPLEIQQRLQSTYGHQHTLSTLIQELVRIDHPTPKPRPNEIELILSKKIMEHLLLFFNQPCSCCHHITHRHIHRRFYRTRTCRHY